MKSSMRCKAGNPARLAICIIAIALSSCATYGEKDLTSFNRQFQRDLPTSPRYRLESVTQTEFFMTVHQGSPLISPGHVRASYLVTAARIVAEDACAQRQHAVTDFQWQQDGDGGWVSVLVRFKCGKFEQHVSTDETNRPASGPRTGSGFVVSEECHVVTAAHVIEGTSEVGVISGGEFISATVVKADTANDLAVLRVNRTCRPLPLGSAEGLARGMEVMTLGYPLIGLQGQEQKANFGRVNALSGVAGDFRHLQIDTPIQPGNSGGPLLTRDGVVVGIVNATLDQKVVFTASGSIAQNVNYAIKIDYLLPLLQGITIVRAPIAGTPVNLEFSDLVSRAEHSVVLVVAN